MTLAAGGMGKLCRIIWGILISLLEQMSAMCQVIDNLYCQFIYKPKHIELIDNNRLAEAVFDTSVLSDGSGIKILQKTMNELGIPTEIDGVIGSKTINNLNKLQDIDAFIERFKQNRNNNFNNPRFNKTHIRRTNSY